RFSPWERPSRNPGPIFVGGDWRLDIEPEPLHRHSCRGELGDRVTAYCLGVLALEGGAPPTRLIPADRAGVSLATIGIAGASKANGKVAQCASFSLGSSSMLFEDNASLGRREQKKLETRRAIRNAGLDLALENGLESLTVELIAHTAGVSPRTFFNYFASKEDALV